MSRKQSISLAGVPAILCALALLTVATVSAAGVLPDWTTTSTTTAKPEPTPTPKPTPKPTPDPRPKPGPIPVDVSTPVCETCKQLAFGVKLQIAHVHPYLGLLCQLNTSEIDVQHCIKLIDASVVNLASRAPVDTCQKLGLCKKILRDETTYVEF